MKLAIVTDAWRPQINGVVTTLHRTRECLQSQGHEVVVITPLDFRTLPCPTYPEIRLAVAPGRKVASILDREAPDAIHIATEAPLGNAARRFCRRNNLRYTASYHTQLPQYVRKRFPIPEKWTYAYLRSLHSGASRVMVPTPHQQQDLVSNGFSNVVIWSRGVDTDLFRPCGNDHLKYERPIWLYAGRVAVEKNLDAFLGAPLPGSKVVVGDGPDMAKLQGAWPDAHFVGYKFGEELARHMSSADVFVFPSRTDTFGLVMLEAMACGTPVAAYPVTGPIDVVRDGFSGALDDDIVAASLRALQIPRSQCREAALERTWDRATAEFYGHLADARGTGLLAQLQPFAAVRSNEAALETAGT